MTTLRMQSLTALALTMVQIMWGGRKLTLNISDWAEWGAEGNARHPWSLLLQTNLDKRKAVHMLDQNTKTKEQQ